jgi:hypothetical protein
VSNRCKLQGPHTGSTDATCGSVSVRKGVEISNLPETSSWIYLERKLIPRFEMTINRGFLPSGIGMEPQLLLRSAAVDVFRPKLLPPRTKYISQSGDCRTRRLDLPEWTCVETDPGDTTGSSLCVVMILSEFKI